MAGHLLAAAASLGWFHGVLAQQLDVARVFDERNVPPIRKLLEKGDYGNVAKLCALFIERGQPSPEWWIMRLESDLALGEVDDIEHHRSTKVTRVTKVTKKAMVPT